jgi:hypothetical protein
MHKALLREVGLLWATSCAIDLRDSTVFTGCIPTGIALVGRRQGGCGGAVEIRCARRGFGSFAAGSVLPDASLVFCCPQSDRSRTRFVVFNGTARRWSVGSQAKEPAPDDTTWCGLLLPFFELFAGNSSTRHTEARTALPQRPARHKSRNQSRHLPHHRRPATAHLKRGSLEARLT